MYSFIPAAVRAIPSGAVRLTSCLASALLAVALSASVQVEPARAGNNWVGPAIAGVIVGAAIAGSGYRYGYRNRYYGPRYPGYYPYGYYPYRRYYRPYYYRAPVVVYPAPALSIRIYPNW